MRIILPGEPIAKMRARISRKGAYDPQSSLKTAARFQILDQLQAYSDLFPIGPEFSVALGMHFYTSCRAGEENLCEWGFNENNFKKDLDNLVKFYGDVMNGIVYDDDRQVNSIAASKRCDMNPRTEIIIMKSKQTISDKTKKVLCSFSPKLFVQMAIDMGKLADQMKSTECLLTDRDFLNTALMICEFSENYASELTKLNKKFPNFAKLLKEEKIKLEGI